MSEGTISAQAAGSDLAASLRPRLRGVELRRRLAAASAFDLGRAWKPERPLGPGVRLIDESVPSAWLDAGCDQASQHEKEEMMIYEVRARFDLAPEPGDDLGCEFVANLVATAVRHGLREAGLEASQGVTVHVRPQGAKVHVAVEAAA